MRHAAVAAALGLALTTNASAERTDDIVAAAVTRYAAGDHTNAVAAIGDARGLTVAPLTRGLERWIATAEPDRTETRTRVAAVFALDAVWHSRLATPGRPRENRDPHGKVTPNDPERVLVSGLLALGYIPRWSVRIFPSSVSVDAFERTFWLTAIGVVEEGSAWHLLTNDMLPLARRRLPGEPRLALADVLARTNRDVGPLRETTIFRRYDLLADDAFPTSVTRRIPGAIKAFETLLETPALAGEAELRIAYLEMRRRRWVETLGRLDRARARLTEPPLVAIADYFTGWILERRKDPETAITAYRRAHAVVPTMNNVSARLAALLFLGDRRAEAYTILDTAFNLPEPPRDLLITLERGDARFVEDHLAALRAALK